MKKDDVNKPTVTHRIVKACCLSDEAMLSARNSDYEVLDVLR